MFWFALSLVLFLAGAVMAEPTPIPSPIPCVATGPCVTFQAGSAAGAAGDEVTIDVTLHTREQQVASSITELTFDGQTSVEAVEGKPLCWAGATIARPVARFSFVSGACPAGVQCSILHVMLLTPDALADGTVLYTCKVRLAPTASAGAHAVTLSLAQASDLKGNEKMPIHRGDGVVTVAPAKKH